MKERSKTFCVYPWVEMMANTTGEHSYCCIAKQKSILKENKIPYRVGQDTFQDAWNSDFMKNLRKDMLDGKKISACETCYFQESIGQTSYRERHNDYWTNKLGEDLDKRIEKSIENDYSVDDPPVYLDLRLGNLCNLKCRMCNHYNSSQIAKESSELLKKDHEFKKIFAHTFKTLKVRDYGTWYESNFMWDEIIGMIPHLKKVYLTGGEPTLIENNYRFMREIINQNRQNDVQLFFNTNTTNGKKEFLDLLEQFPNVSLNCSIDGYRAGNDYIRYPSKWPKIEKVFIEYVKRQNINLNVTPVFQVYNVLSISNLLSWVNTIYKKFDRRIGVDILINDSMPYLNVEILPIKVKILAAKRLQQFSRGYPLYNDNELVKNSVDSCIRLLTKSFKNEDKKQMEYFIKYTRSLDKSRNQKFKNYCPELWQILKDNGYEV